MNLTMSKILLPLQDYAVELHATSQDDLTEDVVMTKVKKAGGADYSGNLANA